MICDLTLVSNAVKSMTDVMILTLEWDAIPIGHGIPHMDALDVVRNRCV